ncbi:MAG TPA: M28 family peptidase [Burkholderiales bacterium]|nr:M28 family peptidase [Burkholderiales bacterium]
MIEQAHLGRHVWTLAGEIGERNVFHPSALSSARDYIVREWRAQGLEPRLQSYLARGIESSNVEVVLQGARHDSQSIVVGAHYDSVMGSPGADDNASAVAALLELSRALAPAPRARTLRMVAFVNEEPPFFFWGKMGSQVYARAARERGEDIRVMLSLEMLGYYRDEPRTQLYPPLFRWFYPNRGNFIGFVANLRSRRVLRRVFHAFRNNCDFPAERAAVPSWIPGVGWSDHLSFWREGYSALMVTDTAFYRYPYYHTAEDTPEKVDYPRLTAVANGLAGALLELANADSL